MPLLVLVDELVVVQMLSTAATKPHRRLAMPDKRGFLDRANDTVDDDKKDRGRFQQRLHMMMMILILQFLSLELEVDFQYLERQSFVELFDIEEKTERERERQRETERESQVSSSFSCVGPVVGGIHKSPHTNTRQSKRVDVCRFV